MMDNVIDNIGPNYARQQVTSFGVLPDGREVQQCNLTNIKGTELLVMEFGGTVRSLCITNKNGTKTDVVLGFDDLESYIDSFNLPSPPYFGATAGRFAGRIGNATFELNGERIYLEKNNGNNSLHGGKSGFSQKLWKIVKVSEFPELSVSLRYKSPAGDGGFPGDLDVVLKYTLTSDNSLIVEYSATASAPTIVNLTHHSYFNLDGHDADVAQQQLYISSAEMLERDNAQIPTGRFIGLVGHPFDFMEPKNCPAAIDDTFVIIKDEQPAATLKSDKTGIKMSVFTDQPGLQVYVGGNCFGILKGKGGTDYHRLSGICFEAQNFPDAPNHENFPSSQLNPGETYYHKTVYHFEIL